MKRIIALLALTLTIVGAATETAAARPVQHVVVDSTFIGNGDLSSGSTSGTFCISGAIRDCGTLTGDYRFAGLGDLTNGGSDLIQSHQTLAGRKGTIDISIVGFYGPFPNGVTNGTGFWWVDGGTGAYSGLRGGGCWTATADFTAAFANLGPPTVVHRDVGDLFAG